MSTDRRLVSTEELYSVVMSLPAEQRHDYVIAHCPDPAVRAEILRRLMELTQTVAKDAAAAPQPQARQAPALSPGTRLGHYRIQRALGAGGMGFVYEALDEDLNRVVAVKVLPLGSYDEISRARFRREAEAASALNHPNIVTVHEVGRDGGIDFIAMERVSGQTLQKLAGGRPMSLRKAMHIATQIADALSAAHEAGIVHRDLKPSNVMVSDRGLVKVLDFGLAKQLFSTDLDLSQTGEIVGTPYYMSPEQAEGKPVDARSDIFAFGSVLYELLTGKRPFQRETPLASLLAISHAEPEPLRRLRPEAPRLLESVFDKCIRKQPFERWQSLADVKLILQELAAEVDAQAQERAAVAPRGAGRLRRYLAGAAGAMAAGVLLTVILPRLWTPEANAAPPSLRMVTAERGLSTAPALSRDGSLLAFASDRAGDGNLDIWIQQIGGGEPLRLTSDGADETDPAFSPDGAQVAFRSEQAGGGIYTVPALGGDPLLIAPKGRNPRFSPDGKSLAYWEGREGSVIPGVSRAALFDLTGGAPKVLDTGLGWSQHPVWSPDGKWLLLYGMPDVSPSTSAVDWWVVPAAGGKAKPVGLRQSAPRLIRRSLPIAVDWHAAGHGWEALFTPDPADHSNLWRLGLAANGKPGGAPETVTIGPGRQAWATTATTEDGLTRLAYADVTVNYDVWRLPVDPRTGLAAGPLQPVTTRLTPEMNPSISADGKQAYFIATRLGTWSIVRKDLETNRERVLYNASDFVYNARVASAGLRLFFTKPPYALFSIPTAGGTLEKLCSECGSVIGVSPAGDRVMLEPARDEHLMMYDVPSGKMIKLADRGGSQIMLSGGQFSADGEWLAFSETDNRNRTSALFIIPLTGPFPVPRESWIPITGDVDLSRDPCFAPSGQFLYYTAETDGFRCVWAQRLDPGSRTAVGEAFPVQHFHTARLALRNRASSGNMISLTAGGGHLAFTLTETTGNVWLEETR